MQQTLQLFIGDTRVDLFKDETVSLTQSIQNVKDIDKVFTEFSKSFNVPASKTNNKIFKHYYNFNITDGFDARKRASATIELNYLPFKKGNIKLEGVEIKNRKPHTYKITFFGNTTTLKEKIGDDKLGTLNLDEYTEDYDFSSVYNKLRANPATNDVIVPLITHTQRLYYKDGEHGEGTGNLWYEQGSGTSHHHGVAWNELKYALRVHKIIEAIESRYSITFSDDFLTDTNDDWNDLFMWLHRKSGGATSEGQITNLSKCVQMFPFNEPQATSNTIPDGCNLEVAENYNDVEDVCSFGNLYAEIIPATGYTTIPYSFTIRRDGNIIYQQSDVIGTQTFDETDLGFTSGTFPSGFYTTTIETNQIMNFTKVDWFFNVNMEGTLGCANPVADSDDFTSYTFTVGEIEFSASLQIPDIGVLEFLSGLFKMFNLTAYVGEDGTIVVQKLDDFYATGVERDITPYLDTDDSSVDAALPYREITLKYEDPKTIFAATNSQLAGKDWGALEYNGGNENNPNNETFAGPKYEIKLPFGHMLYERIIDASDNIRLSVMWGWCVNEGQSPTLIKPLLFYPIYQPIEKAGTSEVLSIINDIDDDGTFLGHTIISGSINIPSNNRKLNAVDSTTTIHFDLEVDEYNGQTAHTGTLFQNYYSNYLTSTFNLKQRLTKVKAYLPMSFLHNYSLADVLTIREHKYRINSIKTDLITGKSELELLNLL
jgi:hypothetical protein